MRPIFALHKTVNGISLPSYNLHHTESIKLKVYIKVDVYNLKLTYILLTIMTRHEKMLICNPTMIGKTDLPTGTT